MAPHESNQVLGRAHIGALLFAHGLMRVLVFTIVGFDAFLERIGYPGFIAYLVLLGELGGGRARMSGAWTRGIALARVPVFPPAQTRWRGGWRAIGSRQRRARR